MLRRPPLLLSQSESLKQWRKKTRDAAALKVIACVTHALAAHQFDSRVHAVAQQPTHACLQALHQNGEDCLEKFLDKYQVGSILACTNRTPAWGRFPSQKVYRVYSTKPNMHIAM